MIKSARKKWSNFELNMFCEQMSMILKSGISVYEGICILDEEATNEDEKEIFSEIIEQMDLGSNFPNTIEGTNVFPKYMIDMINIGELSGRLDDVLEELSHYYSREEKIEQSIKHAIFYPITMVIMMIVVISVLVIKVLPTFNSVFVQLGSELTGFSKTVMDMGLLLTQYSSVFLIFAVIFSLLALWLFKTKQGNKYLYILKAKFFTKNKLSQQIATARFAGGMSLMLASGLDTDQSLEMVETLIENDVMTKKVKKCRSYIDEGISFAESIAKSEIFTGIYSRMLLVGFKTGSTDEVMKNISKRYEDEIDTKLASVIAIIEPSLVAFLSVVVGMVLLSVMLPLMGIMSTI